VTRKKNYWSSVTNDNGCLYMQYGKMSNVNYNLRKSYPIDKKKQPTRKRIFIYVVYVCIRLNGILYYTNSIDFIKLKITYFLLPGSRYIIWVIIVNSLTPVQSYDRRLGTCNVRIVFWGTNLFHFSRKHAHDARRKW